MHFGTKYILKEIRFKMTVLESLFGRIYFQVTHRSTPGFQYLEEVGLINEL